MDQNEWIHRFLNVTNRVSDAHIAKTVTKEFLLDTAREQVELGEAYPLLFPESPNIIEWAERTERYRQALKDAN